MWSFQQQFNKDSKKIECSEEEAFSSFKSCVEYLSTRPVGKKLVNLVNQLLEIYFLFEKKVTFYISKEDPLFTGLNSESPVIKNGGNKRIFIKPIKKISPLLSKVLTLESLEPDEDGYYPLKVIKYSKLSDSEKDNEDKFINEILIYKENIINQENFKQFFAIKIREEKPERSIPTLALAFPGNVQPKYVDDNDPQKSPYFIVLAHELIHMKHFLEEQVFLHQVASELARLCCVEHSSEVIEAVKALCEKSIGTSALEKGIHQLILDSVKSFKKFKELSGLAIKHKINTTCPMRFMGQSLSYVGDLKYFPYSASKERDAEATQFFKYVKKNYINVFGNDDSSFDIESFDNLEELRTVSGPDRDGITENVIRREFGLPYRQKYQ